MTGFVQSTEIGFISSSSGTIDQVGTFQDGSDADWLGEADGGDRRQAKRQPVWLSDAVSMQIKTSHFSNVKGLEPL